VIFCKRPYIIDTKDPPRQFARGGAKPGQDGQENRVRTIKILFFLAIFGAAGLAGYAYFGDMSPDVRLNTVPVPLPSATARDGS
jgi:hypothetical protein